MRVRREVAVRTLAVNMGLMLAEASLVAEMRVLTLRRRECILLPSDTSEALIQGQG